MTVQKNAMHTINKLYQRPDANKLNTHINNTFNNTLVYKTNIISIRRENTSSYNKKKIHCTRNTHTTHTIFPKLTIRYRKPNQEGTSITVWP